MHWNYWMANQPDPVPQQPYLDERTPLSIVSMTTQHPSHGPFTISTRDCGDFYDVVIKHSDGWSLIITEQGEDGGYGSVYATLCNPPKAFDVFKEYRDETGKTFKQTKMKDF